MLGVHGVGIVSEQNKSKKKTVKTCKQIDYSLQAQTKAL